MQVGKGVGMLFIISWKVSLWGVSGGLRRGGGEGEGLGEKDRGGKGGVPEGAAAVEGGGVPGFAEGGAEA